MTTHGAKGEWMASRVYDSRADSDFVRRDVGASGQHYRLRCQHSRCSVKNWCFGCFFRFFIEFVGSREFLGGDVDVGFFADFVLGELIQVANSDNRGMSMVTIKHFFGFNAW